VVERENDVVEEGSRLNELQEELEERMRKIDEVMKGSFCFSPRIVPTSDTTQAEKTRTLWRKLRIV